MSYYEAMPGTIFTQGLPCASYIGKNFINNINVINNLNRSQWNFPKIGSYSAETQVPEINHKLPIMLFPVLDGISTYEIEISIYARCTAGTVYILPFLYTKQTKHTFSWISIAGAWTMHRRSVTIDRGLEGIDYYGVSWYPCMLEIYFQGGGVGAHTYEYNGIYVTAGKGEAI